MAQRKHFIPLESNPDVFTQLAGRLGLSSKFAFHDVLSLDDPDLLAFLPRPALALVLVFPASQGPTYDEDKADKNKGAAAYDGSSGEETVIWFKQTIYNACGLYGILHALSNGEAQENLGKKRFLVYICTIPDIFDPRASTRLAPLAHPRRSHPARHAGPGARPRKLGRAGGGAHGCGGAGRHGSAAGRGRGGAPLCLLRQERREAVRARR